MNYWDAVAKAHQEAKPLLLWHTYSNMVNGGVIERWLPADPAAYLLKTDLFDELLNEGLYPLLATRAKNVIGMDVSQVTLCAARSHNTRLHTTQADVRHLPFADNVFDVIVSNSTLDHFESPREIVDSLRELYRVLQKGGYLLFTLDNSANPVIATRNVFPYRLLRRLNLVPYFVGTTIRPQPLCGLLKDVGFHILDIDAIMHFPRIIAMSVARLLETHAGPDMQRRFYDLLMTFERLSSWPTRFLTGYYTAIRAIKE